MSDPLDYEHRDLEGEFQAGRSEALDAIAANLRTARTRYAEVAVNDFFAFGLNPKEKKAVTEIVSSPFLDHYRQYIIAAVKTLQSGHDLLSIMGQEQIKKYRSITSGDYDAGAVSAAEDMKFLILGMNIDTVVDDFLKTLRGREDLAKIFIKGAENNSHSTQNSEERPKPKYEDTLKRFLIMMIATKLDGDLSRIQQKFIQDNNYPYLVGYEGDQAQPVRFRFLRSIFRRMAEPMNVITRLKGKVPTSWPPFNVSGSFNATGMAIDEQKEDRLSRDELRAMEEEQPVNENKDFGAGFSEALEQIYYQSQSGHFEIMNDAKGGYMAQLGISDFWARTVSQVTTQAYSDFRADVRDLMERDIRGEGQSYEDGARVAQQTVQNYLNAVNVKGSSAGQTEFERVISKFKAFWSNQLQEITDNVIANKNGQHIEPAIVKAVKPT